MDPQKLSQLDPKLRDAYQRVMGTTIPEPQTPAPTQAPVPIQTPSALNGDTVLSPKPQSQATPSIVQPIAKPQFITTPQPQQAAQAPQPAAANFSMPAPQAQTMVLKKKSSGIMPILFGFVGLIFIVIYTLFWTKIFNFKLPFLP